MIGVKLLVLLGAAWPLFLIVLTRKMADAADGLDDSPTLARESKSPSDDVELNSQEQISVQLSEQLPEQDPLHDPYFSLILVAHNEEENLPDLLNDLAAILHRQSEWQGKPCEIILVDERSKDRSPSLMQAFCDEHAEARLLSWPETRGKLDALHLAIPMARGKFILLSDADCRLQPTWPEALCATLEGNAERDGVDMVGASVLLSKTPEVPALSHPLFRLWQSLQWLAMSGTATAFALLGSPVSAYGANLGVRRSTLEAHGGYAKLVRTNKAEDLELFRQLTSRGASFTWNSTANAIVHTRAESFTGTAKQLARWMRSLGGLPLPAMLFVLLAPIAALAPWFLLPYQPLTAGALITAQLFAQWRSFQAWSNLLHVPAPTLGETALWQAFWPIVILRIFAALIVGERDWQAS
jgi:cellulose synthase/poly-beta-1,6-N-acetylglucosamine synthase-like glycosyltransferase